MQDESFRQNEQALYTSCAKAADTVLAGRRQFINKREAPLCLILSPKDKSDPDPKLATGVLAKDVPGHCTMRYGLKRSGNRKIYHNVHLALHFSWVALFQMKNI